ncbi:hypothetical protein CTI12_AA067560 [Artemisia annua]|uniref:DUF4005 domain-containing protein n=1 Tax=Artemisia annua TaxID=35608 RepID=A0A2U1Q6Y1_ARTAN|nr:hypothetical protein CTI12_AA067560 [Artemisia annua]
MRGRLSITYVVIVSLSPYIKPNKYLLHHDIIQSSILRFLNLHNKINDVHSSAPREYKKNKGSDKRGWSFRKRSARHRVLSNTVVTEAPSSEKKETSDPVTTISSVPQVKFNISEKNDISEPVTSISSVPKVISNVSEKKDISEPITSVSAVPQVTSNISEKTSDNIWIEEPPRLSNSVTKDTTVSTIATDTCEDDIKCDPELVTDESESVSESAILVIQAAVRKFLAQRQMVKYKNVVKLQAAVRGHLVRSHAVGTLRCVQAIVKMQALVRARRGNLSAERSSVGEKGVQNPTHVSMEKLLSNSLARQLLESTPKTKQINIKCDPSKSDSAWNWLERWMSVSTPETIESHAPQQEQDKVETVIPSNYESTKMISDVKEATVPCEEDENLISIEENSHLRHDEEEKPQPANTFVPEPVGKPDTPPDEPMELNAEPQIEAVPNPEKPVSEPEPKRSAKRLAADQPDSEGRKSVFGRKASNPAFIAAQSRFEELTSRSNSLKSPTSSSQEDDVSSEPLKSINSSKQDDASSSEPSKSSNKLASEPLEPLSSVDQVTEVGSSVDIGSSAPEKATTLTAVEPRESLVSDSPKVVPTGGSECGTELSITSTLDSPDQSEVENKKFEEEDKVLDEKIVDPHGHDNIDIIMPEKHDSCDDAKPETENTKPANNADVSQVEQKLDESVIEPEPEPKPKIEPEHEMVPQVSEGSPRSHITVPESQGTPSSQVSTNTKKSRSEKKVSSQSQKRKSWSGSKKSSVDSALRSSLDQLPKDPKPEKTEKRRNSFGSPKPDHSDHQPSVPSYMQATESARAKAIANSSPRSSPDVHDKDLKKRHSLPGAVNGRQGSPRIQRSMSQALQTTKANGNQEKKWQR